MGELLFSSQLRTKYKTTMWYLETGLYLCITVGRNLPSLCATWSAATRKELCDPLSSGEVISQVFYVSAEGIQTQHYSRLLHTTLLMPNVMLDKMTSEVTSLWTASQIETQTKSSWFQFDTTDSDTRINKLVRCVGIWAGEIGRLRLWVQIPEPVIKNKSRNGDTCL